MVAAGFERAAIAEFFEAPFAIAEVSEDGQGGCKFRAVFGGVAVDDLLLECAVEALDDAVGLRLADVGEARGEAVEAALPLEVIGGVLAAVVVAQLNAPGRAGLARAEDALHRLGDRLVSGEAVAALADVVPEQLAVQCSTVVNTHSQPSSLVHTFAPSVAQRTFGAKVRMRPSCALAGAATSRCGESR